MDYLWTVILSFARKPLLTWRAILHLIGIKRSRLRTLSRRQDAPYRAVVVGLDEDHWSEFDEAYPEFEKTFAQRDVLTSELRLALMHQKVAVIAFPNAARRRLAAAIDGLTTTIFEASINPSPVLNRDVTTSGPHAEPDVKNEQNTKVPTQPASAKEKADIEQPRRIRNDVAPIAIRLKRVPRATPVRRAGAQAAALQFLQKVLSALAEDPIVFAMISRTGDSVQANDFTPLTLSEVRGMAEDAPERAATVCLGVIYKALATDNRSSLSAALTSAASLPLAPDFLAAIALSINSTEFSEPEQLALRLFLRSLTVRETSEDHDFYSDWYPDLPLLEVLEHNLSDSSDRSDATRGVRWIVAGKAPPAALSHADRDSDPEIICLGQATSFNTLSLSSLARSSPSHRIASLETTKSLRIPPYSESEETLSRHTSRIAGAFCSAIASLLNTSERRVWLSSLELPIDDLLFGRTVEFWSLMEHLHDAPRASDTILAGDADLAMAFLGGLRARGYPEIARIIAPKIGFRPSSDAHDLQCQIIDKAFPSAGAAAENKARSNVLNAFSTGNARPQLTVSPGAAVLIGRNFDRNYNTDLTELGRELRKSRTVVFIPSAGQTIKGRVSTFVESMTDDWYDKVIVGPAARLQTLSGKLAAQTKQNLLPFLVRYAHENKLLDLADVALILSARHQLDAFFSSKIFNYIQAGTETERCLTALQPRHIALLPGRDFISQTACLVSRETGVPTFDIQTVFVGPRSRYKPTKADVQFTIETQSQKLFTTYFGLPLEKTILTGCAKVGIVQEKTRDIDRIAARKRCGVDSELFLIFAGSPFLEDDEPIISAVSEKLSDWPDTRLGIRLHPTCDDAFKAYCKELNIKNNAVARLDALDLPQTLASADIMITRFSNVGLEAALAGKDVIACNFTDAPPPISLDRMGVATVARSTGELLACIDDFRVHGQRWRDLQRSRGSYIEMNQQLLQGSASAYMRTKIDNYLASHPTSPQRTSAKT